MFISLKTHQKIYSKNYSNVQLKMIHNGGRVLKSARCLAHQI